MLNIAKFCFTRGSRHACHYFETKLIPLFNHLIQQKGRPTITMEKTIGNN